MLACPLCGSDGRTDYHGRADAVCVGCGALERQRAVAGQLGHELQPRGSGRCLELAPLNAFVYGDWLRQRGWTYEAFDKRSLREPFEPDGFFRFIDYDADATNLYFAATGGYELFLAQHVFEEIPDYRAAFDEVGRVLEPGGRAILEMPWNPDAAHTEAQEIDQYGNLWRFGADLRDELEARFDAVVMRTLREPGYTGSFFICRTT